MKHNVPIQSLIDHIKTAIDVDPWAKEMVEELLKEQQRRIEVLRSEVKRLDVELVRCKDCKFYPNGDGATKWTPCREIITQPGWYCADGERK